MLMNIPKLQSPGINMTSDNSIAGFQKIFIETFSLWGTTWGIFVAFTAEFGHFLIRKGLENNLHFSE